VGFRCKLCGAEILPQDVDAQRMIAKCRACQTLFDAYSAPEGTDLPPSIRRPPRPREAQDAIPGEVTLDPGRRPPPAGYRVAPGGSGAPLRITLPFSRTARREGCGCGVYLVVAGVLVILIARGEIRGIVAVAAGSSLAIVSYLLTALLLNKTTVTADESSLRIDFGPLPLLSRKRVATSDLEQLFVVSETFPAGRMSTRTHYVLTALIRDGTRRPLMGSEHGEDMLFIERMVERRLGIEDRPVPRTTPRSSEPPP